MLNPDLLIDPAYRPCGQCGYDLRASSSSRCPECGGDSTGDWSRSILPWAHRRSIGRVSAYLRTAWIACAHPTALAADMIRPQLLLDARRFRLATTLVAWVPGVTMVVGFGLARDGLDLKPRLMRRGVVPLWVELVMLLTLAGAWWMFLLCAAGVQSYWFHPKKLPMRLQNQAVALSYYTSAGWVLASLPLTGLAVLQVLFDLDQAGLIAPGVITLVRLATAMSAVVMLLVLLHSTMVLMHRAAGPTWGRLASVALGLPIAWALLAAIWLALLPGIVLMGLLMGLSVI